MSHRNLLHAHPRAITVALGPISATIGSEDSSTSSTSNTKSKSSKTTTSSSQTTKTKDGKSTTSSTSLSSFPIIAAPTSNSTSSITSTSTSPSVTSLSTTSQTAAAATTSAANSSSHSTTSPGLVAFAVIICLAFVGAVAGIIIMRRHHKQREWTFQQHQRIFERFDKSKQEEYRPPTSHPDDGPIYPPMPAAVVDDGRAWSHGTGASVITTGPSVIRKLDWDQGPEKEPKAMIEAKPKRKPVPPPKEPKKKTFSQYLPYLLPQNHSAEVIELAKAEQQVYQRPAYRPAG